MAESEGATETGVAEGISASLSVLKGNHRLNTLGRLPQRGICRFHPDTQAVRPAPILSFVPTFLDSPAISALARAVMSRPFPVLEMAD